MASARSTSRVGVRTSSQRAPVVEEIVPSSGWTEDSAAHYLLVDLPEFKKQEVKLHVDSYGRIIVKGERQTNERKRVHFHLTLPVPLDSDTDKVAGKFDGGILYVTVPKRIAQETKESEAEKAANGNVERAGENERQGPNAADNEERDPSHDSHRVMEEHRNEGRDPSQHYSHRENEEQRNENAQIGELSEGLIRRWEQEPMLRNAVELLRNNKGIVITAVVAFSLGVLVSRKFQFSTEA